MDTKAERFVHSRIISDFLEVAALVFVTEHEIALILCK